jgi:uncharacterized protein (DUF362 family)
MVQVAVVKGTDPYETTLEALKLIGNEIKIPKAPVVLKPNLLLTENFPLVVTAPEVCAAVADFLIDVKKTKQIILAEGTTMGNPPDTFESMQNNGYTPFQDRWTPINLSIDPPSKWFPLYSVKDPRKLEIGIAQTIMNCPFLVSIPKFKTHDVLGLTLSLKNLMGTLVAVRDADTQQIIARETTKTTAYMHGYGPKKPDKLSDALNIGPSKVALAINLNRLAKVIQPSLAVIDGIVVMEGDGPAQGVKKSLNLIIASTDFIAADTVATYIAGMNPLHIQYIHCAGLNGLGEYRLNHISIVGEPLDSITSPFAPHHLFQRAKFSEPQISTLLSNIT